MRSPDGHDFWSVGAFLEIHPPSRLVASDFFSNAEGNIVPASYYGMEGSWPLETRLTVESDDLGGRTRLTLTTSEVTAVAPRDPSDMAIGWNESLDKLAELLARRVGASIAKP